MQETYFPIQENCFRFFIPASAEGDSVY